MDTHEYPNEVKQDPMNCVGCGRPRCMTQECYCHVCGEYHRLCPKCTEFCADEVAGYLVKCPVNNTEIGVARELLGGA